jgi:hypothetical protein
MSTRTLSSTFLLLLIAGASSSGVHAQPTMKAALESGDRAAINAWIVMQLQKAVAGDPKARDKKKDCESKKDCSVEVEIIELYDAARSLKFCAVQSENITIKSGASGTPKKDDETKITWTLKAPSTTAKYEFADLVTFEDNENAVDKTKVDIPSDKKSLSVKHKYKKAAYSFHYFPAVIQTIGTKEPVMCAGIDPKIINE